MTDSRPSTSRKSAAKTSSEKSVDLVTRAVNAIRAENFGGPYVAAMVLGTGLGNLSLDLEDARALPYEAIPGFPLVKVSGHNGQLISGKMAGKPVLIFQGRAHYYETGEPDVMRVPLATLVELGGPPLLLTNAAGSTRADVRPGSLLLIRDHINLSGRNPLIGETGDTRFVSMNDAYDPNLRRRLKAAGQAAGIMLHEGTYMWFSGPSFETPAEIRMARTLGADLVGMSTVPEVILARRYGLNVVAISVVTNLAAGIQGFSPSHSDTRDVANTSGAGLRRIIREFINGLNNV